MLHSADVAIKTVLCLLAILDIVGNALVCAIVKRNRDMRTPINYLIVNLAVADILYGAFMAPRIFLKLNVTHPDGVTGTVLCKLLTDGNVAWVGATSSFVTLVAIAIERYYAVTYPLGNRGKLTKRKLKVIISSTWVFAFILNIPAFLAKDVGKENNGNLCVSIWPAGWMRKAYSLSWKVVVFLSCAVMAVLYSRVVYTLWFKRDDDNPLKHQQKGVIRVRKRVTLMIVTITAVFGICWGTNQVIYLLRNVASDNIDVVTIATANTMVMFNSAVNPFVYALMNKQFREKTKRMIVCTESSTSRLHPTPKHGNTDLANDTIQPTDVTGPCFMELQVPGVVIFSRRAPLKNIIQLTSYTRTPFNAEPTFSTDLGFN